MSEMFGWVGALALVCGLALGGMALYPGCENANAGEARMRHEECAHMCGEAGVLIYNGGDNSSKAELECVCKP